MNSKIIKSKLLIWLLCVSIIGGSFSGNISIVQAKTDTKRQDTISLNRSEEKSYPEPVPTTSPPVTSNYEARPISELSSPLSSRTNAPTVQSDTYIEESSKPADGLKILEDPAIKELSAKYVTRFGTKNPYLSKEQIEALFSQGAEFTDVYAIALLQDLYHTEALELLKMKQTRKVTWLELDSLLSLAESTESERSEKVSTNVYRNLFIDPLITSEIATPFTVSDAVYMNANLESTVQEKLNSAFALLSATISSVIQSSTMSQINQTFKEQYSDHYGTSETIDPVTGSLTWKDNQISLPGRDGLDLNVGVIYQSNQAASGGPFSSYEQGVFYNNKSGYNYGDLKSYLGLGWSFRFPSLELSNDYNKFNYHDGEGGAYEAEKLTDFSWRLKDYPTDDIVININDAGIYTVEHIDGKIEYYSPKGDLTKIRDRFGNEIQFNYLTLDNFSYDKQVLQSITDSLGRKIIFTYVRPTPNNHEGEKVKLEVFNADNQFVQRVIYLKHISNYARLPILKSIEVEDGDQTSFEYDTVQSKFDFYHTDYYEGVTNFLPYQFLKKIKFNQTSEVNFTHESAKHSFQWEGYIEQERITRRYDLIMKSNAAPQIVNQVSYSYEAEYSNYPQPFGRPDEPLPAGYQYSSSATQIGSNGQPEKITKTTFNNLKKTESVETRVLSGAQTGERKTVLYSNYHPKFKYNPTTIESREYSSDADSNPNSLFTDVTYDDSGYVIAQTAALTPAQRNNTNVRAKYTTSYTYNPTFHFISTQSGYQNESDGAPLTTSLTYNAQGRILSSVNVLGEVTTYTYENAPDGSGKLYRATEEKTVNGKVVSKSVTTYGGETRYAYPTKQEIYSNIGQSNPQILSKTMAYDMDRGSLLSETDGNNQTTSYTYDALGRLLKVTKPNFTNANGTSYSETEEYKYTYNQVSTNYDAVNAGTLSFVVDTIHSLTQISNGSSVKSYGIVFYNGLGQALLEERYDPNVQRYTQTQYHYDEWSRPVYSIDPAGNTLTASYDGWGRQNRATNANSDQMLSDYDFKSRISTSYIKDHTTGEVLNYVQHSYDPWGNKLSASTYKDWPTKQQRMEETYRYDILGNVTGYTDPNRNLNEDGVTTSYAYDALGRLTSLKDALNQTTNYSYDGNGQVTKVTIQTKGGAPQTLNTKTYNELGLPSVKQDGASQSESYTYNNLGQLAEKTDRNGSSFGYVYDERGQLKTSTIRGSINNVEQTQETKMITGDEGPQQQTIQTFTNGVRTASHKQTLNSLGQLRSTYSESGGHTAWIGNQLDVLGRMTKITDNYMGFTANYQYQKERLDKVQTNGSSALNSDPSVNAQYSYEANNQIQRIVYPTLTDGSQLVTTYTYNKALGWTETMANTKGGGSLSSYSYSYDNNGNRIAVSESRNESAEQRTNYGYDALNRLISISRPDGSQTTYTYDVRGNRLTLSDTSTTNLDAADTSYTYDLQNTLTSVTKGGASTSFKYYADGMRSMKTKGNIQTQVNYDFQGQVISEEKVVNGDYVEQANFVRGDRVLVKKDKKAAKDYYYLYNGHGDVVQIVDTTGKVVNNYTYDEWGNITGQKEEISNSFKYTGEVYDEETGLYYLRARYYDPSMGRFLNEDTVEGQIDNPLSQNLYTYVENNPLKYIDPSGHSAMAAGGLYLIPGFGEVLAVVTGAGIVFYGGYKIYQWATAPKEAPSVSIPKKPELKVIPGGNNSNKPESNPRPKVSPVSQPNNDKQRKEPTKIYRLGSDSPWNLTPREKDGTTGLSFLLTRPTSGSYIETTVEDVNNSGLLVAIIDGKNHVSVVPSDGRLTYWASQRPNTGDAARDSYNYNIQGSWNAYTTEMLKIFGSYDKWVQKKGGL
ncbi:RHS repeat protein [Paenibacillus tritici]|uniref:RHS repeat domain-containing protein n=1 Tax=Paenibacillus tritici TaxID=1873425 RepID=UPI001BA57677|nr:RHS repeat-associated core domain-containing protein [Paenibacillus tritici]QUL56314.1 RHS repeat protein [Paenibacillus tritici]